MPRIEPGKRSLPIQIIDSPPLAAAGHGHAHDGADEGPRSLGAPPPCLLFVGDTAISEAEIAREMQFHRAMRPEQSRAAAARALVVRELLRREVARLGLDGRTGSHGGEPAEEALIRILLEREILDRTPSEADCLRYFEHNRERFRSPDRIRLRHILLAAPADDAAARFRARSEGERLVAELRADPVLFADFALRHSQCPSKDQGGDLGWLQRGQTTPEFDRQVFRLDEGLAAFPVESRWGYHVVCVDAIERGEALGFEQMRGQISEYLELQVRQQEVQNYLLALCERHGVSGLDEIEAQAA